MKKILINNKIPLFLRYKIKYYDFELDDKSNRQLVLLVEACNIKDRKKRLEFIYNKSCELLDEEFSCGLCGFKNNKCLAGRVNGCCRECRYLINNRCSTMNLACKFHTCNELKRRGYVFRINDILMIKYLYTWKQKLFCYYNLFISKEEFLDDIYKNSIILWAFKRR